MSHDKSEKKLVTVNIDGKEISVDNKTTILEAAGLLGINIPTLCYLPRLLPIGSCRVCLVNIEGLDEPVTSCDTPVADKMVVQTTGEDIERLRRQAIQFLLLNHPLECTVCDKGGECELQDITYKLDVQKQDYWLDWANWENDTASPLIFRSDGRCIRCGRCVAICDQVQDRMALTFSGKGYDASIRPTLGEKLDCEFCGQCVSVCPVGALIAKPFLNKSRVWDLAENESVCAFCGAGCAVSIHHRDDQLYRLLSDRDSTHNKGDLCSRGSFGFHYTKSENRLYSAKIRKGDDFKDAEMDSAISYASEEFAKIVKEHGPKAVAAIGSSRMTNEDAYSYSKFIKEIVGSPNLDTEAGFGYRQILDRTYGRPVGKYNDLESCDAILIFGSDFAIEMPVPSLRVIAAAKQGDSKLIVCAPYNTKLHRNARFPIIYKPGTERELAFAMIRIATKQGYVKESVISKNDAKNLPDDIDALCQACGVEKSFLEKAVQAFFTAEKRGMVVGPFGFGDCTKRGPASLLALAGEPHIFLPSADRANMQGVYDVGCVPDEKGKSYRQIISEIEKGKIKALWVAGSDPVALFGDRAKALEKLDLLVVQDSFFTATAKMAHVVLPVAAWSEKEGSYTSSECRVQFLEKAVAPANDLPTDSVIFSEAAKAFNGELDYIPAVIWDKLSLEISGYPKNLGAGGAFVEKEKTTAKPYAPSAKDEIENISLDENQYMAVAGSSLFLNGTICSHSAPLLTVFQEPFLVMNPVDMEKLKAEDGQKVKISTEYSTALMTLKGDENIPTGVLLVNTNFADSKTAGLFLRPFGSAPAKLELVD